MTLRRLVISVTFLAIFSMAARVSMDSDTWWHLRAGQRILEQRTWLTSDPFSYTRLGAEWRYPGWLVEVPLVLLFQALGPGGLNLWTACMVTLAFMILWSVIPGGPFLRAFVLILAAAASAVYWAARPYLVTFVFFSWYVWVLETWRAGRSRPWHLISLPVVMLAWGNSHGGFAAGFLLWGAYLAAAVGERVARRLDWINGTGEFQSQNLVTFGLAGAGMLVAACLNPAGPAMLGYPFRTVSIGALQAYIQEWQSPDFHLRQTQPFLGLILVLLAGLGGSRRRLALVDCFTVGGFLYMSLMAGRNIALFALVTTPVVARHWQDILDRMGEIYLSRRGLLQSSPLPLLTQRILNAVLISVLCLAALARLALAWPASANEKVFRQTLPVQAVRFLRTQRPPGRLFNSYNWGAYLLWSLPEYPVFVDGRTDLYDDRVIQQWLQIMQAGAGWQATLDEYQVGVILIEAGSTLDRVLENRQNWQPIYRDELAVIYQRRPAASSQLARPIQRKKL